MNRQCETRSRADGVVQNLGALGKVGLPKAHFGQRASALGVKRSKMSDDFGASRHGDASCARGGRCAEVVGGRSETSGDENMAMGGRKTLNRSDDAIGVIVDAGVLKHIEAACRKLVAEPRGIGIDELATR